VTAVFGVVVFGERWDHGCAAGDLAHAVQDDFSVAVLEFDFCVNLDGAACQATNVADIFRSVRETTPVKGRPSDLHKTRGSELPSCRP
jgi:hypothetical protein